MGNLLGGVSFREPTTVEDCDSTWQTDSEPEPEELGPGGGEGPGQEPEQTAQSRERAGGRPCASSAPDEDAEAAGAEQSGDATEAIVKPKRSFYAARDLYKYRHQYPNFKDIRYQNDLSNLRFYKNKIPFKPDDATVELSLDSTQNNQKKVLGKTLISLPPQEGTNSSKSQPSYEELEEEEQEDQFDLTVGVTDPEKIGDGMNAYVAYKVTTQTSLPVFRSKQFAVKRRFSDFLGLYEKLSEKHSQNGFIVPPPPEKSLIGMTKVKVGKEDSSSAEFLEKRRAALERYLQRIVNHPTMLQDPDVREFLEKEELPRAVGTQTLSGAGLLKMFNKATDAVSKMTIKMNESDIWFEEKLQEVECEEQRLRKLHAVVETLVNHRKELALNTAQFAKSLAMLGSSEDNTALSRALSQLAEVEEKIEQLHQEQANNDFFLLAELLSDYIRLLAIVRAAFDQRMKTWQRWQDAQTTLQKKREAEARLLWANKPDKLQQAKDEITEWESRVTQYERDFERISAVVRKEVIRFEKEKSKDFKNHVIKYLETLLYSQQQLAKYWEAFLPEAKAIS